jgi:EAL domain-containing protein (putative c-di-GMP-specific phosphodiesterase class I)
LIVDDSTLQRAHAAALCRALGVTTLHEAGNGREAIALLAGLARLPDLMILDLEMPTMDGSQTLEEMRSHGIDLPVLIVSSREIPLLNMISDIGSVLGLRIIGVQQKPLRLEALESSLRDYLPFVAHKTTPATLGLVAADLRSALENGEIQAHYQPKVNVRTAVLTGVETLARWQHPVHGLVPPSEFIPLAEREGLIHALTLRIMSEAMLQAADWQARGLHLSIAINISPVLLSRPSLPDEVFAIQNSFDIPAGKVMLEITESSVIGSGSVPLGVLARLRIKGFGLSIDDYGTGFSSLQQLTRIPFSELKIDRSFVHQAHARADREVILRSALELASRLGIKSVAEGVETIEDWHLLQKLGCDLAQGYLIGKPMPGAELLAWHKAHKLRNAELAPLTESRAQPAGNRRGA